MKYISAGMARRHAPLACTLFLWAFGPGIAWAQSKSCQTAPLLVAVLDEQGMPAPGLKAGDFHVKVNGKDAKVLQAAEEAKRRRAVILLDTNPGMRDDSTGKWTLAREIATHIVQEGPWEGVPGFAIFGDAGKKGESKTSLDPIENPKNYDFKAISAGIGLAGPTVHPAPLFDAVYDGFSMLNRPQLGDVLFLVTDAGDAGSKKKHKDVLDSLLAAGVRMYAITLPMRYDAQLVVSRSALSTDALQQHENTDFMNMVVTSGGSFLRILPNRRTNVWGFKFTDEERLRMATSLQLLYLQAARVYRVELEIPAGTGVARNKVEVSFDSPAHKKLHVRHAKFIAPCGSPS
jgi:hypothetical protein